MGHRCEVCRRKGDTVEAIGIVDGTHVCSKHAFDGRPILPLPPFTPEPEHQWSMADELPAIMIVLIIVVTIISFWFDVLKYFPKGYFSGER